MSNGLQLKQLRGLIVGLREASAAASKTGSGLLEGESDAAENPAVYVAYARAAAILGDWDLAGEALSWAEEELDFDKFLRRGKQDQQQTQRQPSGEKGQERASASMRQFARHRFDEIKRDAAAIKSFVRRRRNESVTAQLGRLIGCYRRTLCFGHNRTDAGTTFDSFAPVLKRHFGLESCLVRISTVPGAATALHASPTDFASFDASMRTLATPAGKVDFGKVFVESGADLPLKLEIGCGTGEWAVAQAACDIGKANWIALELRYDRVYNTFSRAMFSKGDNVCAAGGDAAYIMAHHFDRCIDHVYVNYPEPPERASGIGDSEGQHLYTPAFFGTLKACLKEGGAITILTDNLAYGKSLALVALAAGFVSIPPRQTAYIDPPTVVSLAESHMGCVRLYEGLPGPEGGHHETATSSYFDRMWEGGNKKKRYHLVLQS